MKCTVVQRLLLSMANPECVPASVRGHLARCAACREWHNQLVLLERHIPLLPIPASNGKAKLMRHVLRDHPSPSPAAVVPPAEPAVAATSADTHTPTLLRSRIQIIGVATVVVLLTLGWFGIEQWLEHPAIMPDGTDPERSAPP
jgi:hypothetical protein